MLGQIAPTETSVDSGIDLVSEDFRTFSRAFHLLPQRAEVTVPIRVLCHRK